MFFCSNLWTLNECQAKSHILKHLFLLLQEKFFDDYLFLVLLTIDRYTFFQSNNEVPWVIMGSLGTLLGSAVLQNRKSLVFLCRDIWRKSFEPNTECFEKCMSCASAIYFRICLRWLYLEFAIESQIAGKLKIGHKDEIHVTTPWRSSRLNTLTALKAIVTLNIVNAARCKSPH